MTDAQGNSTTGTGAVVSAITSAIALIAALHPKWSWLVTLSQHAPELTNILPYVLGPIGVIGAAISHPPTWIREPWDGLKQWIAVTFRKRPTP